MHADKAIGGELSDDVEEALKMHLLLSELRPVVENSYSAMSLRSFLAMYHAYLYSGLFTETSDPSESDGPTFHKEG